MMHKLYVKEEGSYFYIINIYSFHISKGKDFFIVCPRIDSSQIFKRG